jgi:hypothetical protein
MEGRLKPHDALVCLAHVPQGASAAQRSVEALKRTD